MDLIEYLNIRVSKSGKYFRLVEHDSLVIDPERNSFFWNSRGVYGSPARFVKEYYDFNDEQLKKFLRKFYLEHTKQGFKGTTEITNIKKQKKRKALIKESKLDYQGYMYLCKKRGLDKKTVQSLEANNLIGSDQKHNIVFYWRNLEGKLVGQDLQGTYIDYERFPKHGTFKSIHEASLHDYGFNLTIGDKFEHLYVFESPIDLLSYWQLFSDEIKNAKLLSLNGAGTKIATINNFLKDQAKDPNDFKKLLLPKYIHLAPDNDIAGQNLISKFEDLRLKQNSEIYSLNIVEWSPYKDWNEQVLRNHNVPNKKSKLTMNLETFNSLKIYQKLERMWND